MPPKANAKGGAGAGKRRARSDADEALEDSLAEVNDVSAVLSSPAAAAGESTGRPEPLRCQNHCCSADWTEKEPKRKKQSRRRK
jgi:hypothetical protein